ncbi:hypothetical protein JCM11641_008275 [Rhodosporidiobolus odoratus]
MGVHGLTSFVRKNNSLGDYLNLPLPLDQPTTTTIPIPIQPIPFIVDGLAFIYHVGLVDTFRGGNYATVRANLRSYILYWRACGLEPEFVWDGPFDSAKLPTVISRSSQSLARSIAYMRASDTARATPNLRNSASRLPPLTHMAVSAELEALGVASHCAEEEADSPTAELAQRKNGFMVSNDSDYFIFNAQCRGYVPLASIEYGRYNHPRVENPQHVPPSDPPSMRMRVYRFKDVARSLSLPPAFLPILAALVGNDLADYSSELFLPRPPGARPLFPGQVDHKEFLRIAGALSRSSKMPIATVSDIHLVFANVLPRLLVSPSKDPDIILNLAASALGYTLRPFETPSPSYPLHPALSDNPFAAKSRLLYETAYKSSHLSSFFLHVLKHATVIIQGSVEIPDYQSPMVMLGRPLRIWVYAILQDSFSGVLPHGPRVIEYVRRQDELHPADVAVPLLGTLVSAAGGNPALYLAPPSPILLAPQSLRLSLFLLAVSFPTLPPPPQSRLAPFLPLVLTLRHIQHFSKRPWTEHEQLSALLVAVLLRSAPTALPSLPQKVVNLPRLPYTQRSVELVQTLVFVNLLGQSLLLCTGQVDAEGAVGTLRPPFEFFDGASLHAFLELAPDLGTQ